MKSYKFIFSVLLSVLLTACSFKVKQENKTEAAVPTTDSTSVKAVQAYVCPMNCENKTYADTGRCPVCKMQLEKQAH